MRLRHIIICDLFLIFPHYLIFGKEGYLNIKCVFIFSAIFFFCIVLSATLQTMSIIVVNLQDNRAVFWIFITLLRFSFDSPSYIENLLGLHWGIWREIVALIFHVTVNVLLFFRIRIGWGWWLNIMYFSFTKVSIFFTTARNWRSGPPPCRSSKLLFSVTVNTQQWNCMWCL